MRSNIGVVVAGILVSQVGLAADVPLEETLRALWTTAYNSGNAGSLGAMYATDARLQQGYCPAVVGRDAIESFWRSDLGAGATTTQLRIEDSVSAPDLLYVSGTYSVEVPDKAHSIGGTYSQIWRRGAGGDWTVHREIWGNLACADGLATPDSERPAAPISPEGSATSV